MKINKLKTEYGGILKTCCSGQEAKFKTNYSILRMLKWATFRYGARNQDDGLSEEERS